MSEHEAVEGEVKSYRVNLYGQSRYGGGKEYPAHAYIHFYGLDGKEIGKAFFVRDPAKLPLRDARHPDMSFNSYFPWEDFPKVLALVQSGCRLVARFHPDFEMAEIGAFGTQIIPAQGSQEEPPPRPEEPGEEWSQSRRAEGDDR